MFDQFNANFDEQFKAQPLLSEMAIDDKPLAVTGDNNAKPDNTALASAHARTVTASNAYRLCADKDSASLTEGGRSYVQEMVDALLGKERGQFDTAATAWGRQHEAEAIAKFCELTGEEVSFVGDNQKRFYYGDFVSALPDGLVTASAESGSYAAVVEVKCLDTENHKLFLSANSPAEFKAMALDKYAQIQVQMLCTNCTHGFFIFYDPRHTDQPLHVICVVEDLEFIEFFLRRVALAREYYNQLLAEDRTAAGFAISSEPVDDIKLLPQVSLDIELVKQYHADPEKLVQIIQKQAGSWVFDMTTIKGREACKSHANKVIKCISPALDASKRLAEDAKRAIKADLAFRTAVETGLRQVAADIRQPYTEWEAEQKRIKAEEARLQAEAEQREADRIAEEQRIKDEAERKRLQAIEDELAALKKEKADREAAEAKVKADAEEAERLEKIQREADERAKVKAETDRIEREAEHQRELERLEQKRIDDLAAAELAEKQRAEKAEKDRLAVIAANELAIKQQAEKAERERLQAIEDERKRAEQQRKDEAAEAERVRQIEAKKAANRKHQAEVNRVILAELVNMGIGETPAKAIISKAAKRELGVLVINY